MSQMADFPPLLASSIFDLYKQETLQIKSQTMRHTSMNLVNTTYLRNMWTNKNEHLWVLTKFNSCVYNLHIPLSLSQTNYYLLLM